VFAVRNGKVNIAGNNGDYDSCTYSFVRLWRWSFANPLVCDSTC